MADFEKLLGQARGGLAKVGDALTSAAASPAGRAITETIGSTARAYPTAVASAVNPAAAGANWAQFRQGEMVRRQEQREQAMMAELAGSGFDPSTPQGAQHAVRVFYKYGRPELALRYMELLQTGQLKRAELELEAAEAGVPGTKEIGTLRDRVMKDSLRFDQLQFAYDAVREAANDPGGDLALVAGFARLIDPGSVVREGERYMVQAVGGMTEELAAKLNELLSKRTLTTNQREWLMNQAHKYMEAAERRQRTRLGSWRQMATAGNYPLEQVVPPHLDPDSDWYNTQWRGPRPEVERDPIVPTPGMTGMTVTTPGGHQVTIREKE